MPKIVCVLFVVFCCSVLTVALDSVILAGIMQTQKYTKSMVGYNQSHVVKHQNFAYVFDGLLRNSNFIVFQNGAPTPHEVREISAFCKHYHLTPLFDDIRGILTFRSKHNHQLTMDDIEKMRRGNEQAIEKRTVVSTQRVRDAAEPQGCKLQ